MSHTKWLLLPEEGAYINFQNLKRLEKAAFIIYGDFECVLVPSTDNVDICKKYQDHAVCSYGYRLVCLDEWYNKPYNA